MKVRILSSIAGLIVLAAVIWSDWFLSGAPIGIAVFILSVIGMREFYNAVSNAGYKPIRVVGYICCVPVLVIGLEGMSAKLGKYIDILKSLNYFSLGMFMVIVVLFSIIIFQHDKYSLNDISITIFGALYIAFLFSFFVLTRNLDNGFFYMWFIFIGAWITDTFAYFTGVFIGKTKILPTVSAKKTLEGSIGGVVGCIVITMLYGIFISRHVKSIPLYDFFFLGLISGIISQIGDWAASAVKRYVSIKDYGTIMPGHGGVLDRFDSILFISPVVYFYFTLLILR